MATTLERISALEAERQRLLASGDDWSFADESRRRRIADIKSELELLWHQERQNRAQAKKSHGRRLSDIRDI